MAQPRGTERPGRGERLGRSLCPHRTTRTSGGHGPTAQQQTARSDPLRRLHAAATGACRSRAARNTTTPAGAHIGTADNRATPAKPHPPTHRTSTPADLRHRAAESATATNRPTLAQARRPSYHTAFTPTPVKTASTARPPARTAAAVREHAADLSHRVAAPTDTGRNRVRNGPLARTEADAPRARQPTTPRLCTDTAPETRTDPTARNRGPQREKPGPPKWTGLFRI